MACTLSKGYPETGTDMNRFRQLSIDRTLIFKSFQCKLICIRTGKWPWMLSTGIPTSGKLQSIQLQLQSIQLHSIQLHSIQLQSIQTVAVYTVAVYTVAVYTVAVYTVAVYTRVYTA